MNMNLNLDDDEEDDDDDYDGEVQQNVGKEAEEGDNMGVGEEEQVPEREQAEVFADEANNDVSAAGDATTTAGTFNTDNEVLDHEQDEEDTPTPPPLLLMMMQPADVLTRLAYKHAQKKKAGAGAGAEAAAMVGLTSDGNEAATAADTGVRFVAPARNAHRRTRANNQHKSKKKHKSSKGLALSTLLCEGYNIEQRNCNSFECSGKCNEPSNS